MALPPGRSPCVGRRHPGAAVPAALGMRSEVEGGDQPFAGSHAASLPRSGGAHPRVAATASGVLGGAAEEGAARLGPLDEEVRRRAPR